PGTLDYSSPEQRYGLAVDVRSDVFSLAVLAYELLTGRQPGRIYVSASEYNARLPVRLDAVLRRGLARKPADRYATVEEFREALARALHHRPARRRSLGVGVVLALVLLGAITLAAPWWKDTASPATAPGTQSHVEVPSIRCWSIGDQPAERAWLLGDGITGPG